MRIALLTYSTKPRGGVVHTLALAEALVAAGEQVDVWTLGRGGDRTFFRRVDPRVGLCVVPFTAQDGETVGERILRSIESLRASFTPDLYDIVHAQDCISANAVDRSVRTVHHLDTFTTPELVACHERAIVRPLALICVSAAVAAEVQQGWGLAATVIPNGVDSARFGAAAGATPDAIAAVARWQRSLGRYVLAVGGIEPRKGSIDLLEAFALVQTAVPDARLVFAGGETLFDYSGYRARFEARAAELGVSYELLGTVDDDELPSLVAGAAVLSFVSTKEGFGLAAMEALAAGVPVVARDLPVLREVFGGTVSYASDVAGIAAALARLLALRPAPGAPAPPARPAAARPAATSLTPDSAFPARSGDANRSSAPSLERFGALRRVEEDAAPGEGGWDPERGRALARTFSWASAAESHRDLYRALIARSAFGPVAPGGPAVTAPTPPAADA
ncbi:glycosyl transferase family 1 [Subtercola boreus]|uniref:Glycosyl transferase family 1 n=1 Tax=Subtercola boreus TaxID=120213 RepID=A0A3E0W0N8_9MICO|nr:MSMEG_0565 family glycosyltransferase [Subtercola boreus]RFA15083.1 glycosyl transferase family 1 [Subtercola boreus]